MTALRRVRQLGENNLALKLFALALATLLYFAVRPTTPRAQPAVQAGEPAVKISSGGVAGVSGGSPAATRARCGSPAR